MTDPETFPCSVCGAEIEVDPEEIGTVDSPVSCSNCGGEVIVSVEWVNYAVRSFRGAA